MCCAICQSCVSCGSELSDLQQQGGHQSGCGRSRQSAASCAVAVVCCAHTHTHMAVDAGRHCAGGDQANHIARLILSTIMMMMIMMTLFVNRMVSSMVIINVIHCNAMQMQCSAVQLAIIRKSRDQTIRVVRDGDYGHGHGDDDVQYIVYDQKEKADIHIVRREIRDEE